MDAQVIQVIEVYWPVGRGIATDPMRRNRRYYTLDGKLLAEVDEWKEEQGRERANTRPEASE